MATLHRHSWEYNLLLRAHEVWHSSATLAPLPIRDRQLLNRAYAHCESVTATHSKSFYLATRLMPHDKRRAIQALYAFCRVSDDIVDGPGGNGEELLAVWRRKAMSLKPPPTDLVATAWADTRLRYRIPNQYAEQLIEGVARDLRQKRYGTFEDLAAYAYGVASTVGLMSMYIIGFAGIEAIPYAVKLGVALQLTNILRDVGEDCQAGRIYLPLEELARYSLTEQDLGNGRVDKRWRAFMRFQIERNRRLYAEAWPGIALLNKDGRGAVAAAGELYRAILDDVEAHDYDVFNRRAHVSAWNKLRRLPGIWWRNR